MEKFDLRENERLIGKEYASHITKLLVFPQANPGKLFVTNQRVAFKVTQGRVHSEFEYPLSELQSFSPGMALVLRLKDGKSHKLTGMYNKKLASYLEEAGVAKG